MRKLIVIVILALTSINLFAQNIEGEWNVGQENTFIRISRNEKGKYEGRIGASDNTKVKKGIVMLKDVIKTSDGFKGKIFAIRRQTWHKCKISPRAEILEISIKAGFKSKTFKWEKVK